jgi:hypothetical protein
MFHGIVQEFFSNEVEIPALFIGQFEKGNRIGKNDVKLNAKRFKGLVRTFPDISQQIFHRVILRIQRPDDLAHGLDKPARRNGNNLHILF